MSVNVSSGTWGQEFVVGLYANLFDRTVRPMNVHSNGFMCVHFCAEFYKAPGFVNFCGSGQKSGGHQQQRVKHLRSL